jgi:hypothetical protein
MDDPIDLGRCCSCQQPGPTVRNLIALDVAAPIPGTGWGCVVCSVPNNGALAVLCDACLEAEAPIVDVCYGHAASGLRSAREACIEPFEHDMTKHEEDL